MGSKAMTCTTAAGALLLTLSACSGGDSEAAPSGAPAPTEALPGTTEDGVYTPDCPEGSPGSTSGVTVHDDVDIPASVDVCQVYVDPDSDPLTEEDIVPLAPENELTVECTDQEALAENASHEPAGWPQDWDGEGAMPDPECHPDFIEVHRWDRFDEFHACWEGTETSTAVRTPDMTDAEAHRILWGQS